MAVMKRIPFKVSIFLIILLQGFSTSLGLEIIFPNDDELIINANTDITIVCEGTHLVSWVYPNSTDLSEKSSTITTKFSKVDGKYTAYLHITSASYLDTGFYTCTSSEETETSKSLYLYVKDENNLTVTRDNEYVNVITGEKAIIPCRPTSPDVQVDLYKETEDQMDENEFYEFDPKYGFSLYINDEFTQLYTCSFSLGNVTKEIEIYVHVIRKSQEVAIASVNDLNNGHTVVGETLNLTCVIHTDGSFAQSWVLPNPAAEKEKRVFNQSSDIRTESTHIRILRIVNTTLADKGVYTCVVFDHYNRVESEYYVNIYDTDEHYLELHEDNGVYEISVLADTKSSVTWSINVTAHPVPKLVWYNNRNEIILGIDDFLGKYNITNRPHRATLKINDVSISDRGYYELMAFNNFEKKTLKLFLNVSGKPILNLEKQDFYLINKPAFANCSVSAFPKPRIYWTVEMCPDNPCSSRRISSVETDISDFEIISTVTIAPQYSGKLTCHANNSLGDSNITVTFEVTDVEHGFGVWNPNDDFESNGSDTFGSAVLGESLTLICGATVGYYSNNLSWYFINDIDEIELKTDDHYTIDRSYTKYSYRSSLTINKAMIADSGKYECRGEEILNDIRTDKIAHVYLEFKEPMIPVITQTNLNDDTFETNTPEEVEFICSAEGNPKPKIIWLKDDNYLWNLNQTRIKVVDHNERLIFSYTLEEDEGKYTCQAENRYGTASKSVTLNFKNKSEMLTYILAGVAVLVVFLLVLIIAIIREQKQKKRLMQELKSIGLMNFEKGALENLNPELGVDDQAELLPYDTKFEFPRDKLKLGKQLGAGAFGIVVKAEAKGIIDREDSTIVAVKMVKRNADASHIKSLASELKIMVHLGNHLNVVNLLGACTKDAAKTRELLVIVEYCRFGNIHNFLIRHRQNFINQLDPKTKNVDFSIGADILQRTLSVSSSRSDATCNSNEYRGENSAVSCGTTQTMSTTVGTSPNGDSEDVFVTSNNSTQPEWRSNYRGDYRGIVKTIATRDLISWAFQVARGMEYLASRKVLHGDLAARNVLLADNNVVKICDFGLAKSIYKNDNYQKKGDGLLPVKWMAIESIQDRIFSTQSDVWSYGIVLWELFSLARTPYPGMEANERLYQKLLEGYRMDSPQYAFKEIYQIMLECWHPNPICRPSFTKLSHEIGLMLEESVRQHYIDLNDPYLKMNTHRLEQQEDYLAMLSPPDFANLSSPNHYINEPVISETASPTNFENSGYLCMKPNNIFSPSPLDTSTFVFENKRKPLEDSKSDEGIEMEPMLGGGNESDYESQPNSPTFTNSFSNPSYHVAPNITCPKNDLNILHSTDNYVNMPQKKCAILNSANNGLQDENNGANNEYKHNYVNSSSRDWEKIIV